MHVYSKAQVRPVSRKMTYFHGENPVFLFTNSGFCDTIKGRQFLLFATGRRRESIIIHHSRILFRDFSRNGRRKQRMYKIIRKRVLNPTVTQMEIEAPLVAA